MDDAGLDANRAATQAAGAAVAHFLTGDEEAVMDCLRSAPVPPGITVGLLRFAALAVAELGQAIDISHEAVTRDLILRVAALED